MRAVPPQSAQNGRWPEAPTTASIAGHSYRPSGPRVWVPPGAPPAAPSVGSPDLGCLKQSLFFIWGAIWGVTPDHTPDSPRVLTHPRFPKRTDHFLSERRRCRLVQDCAIPSRISSKKTMVVGYRGASSTSSAASSRPAELPLRSPEPLCVARKYCACGTTPIVCIAGLYGCLPLHTGATSFMTGAPARVRGLK